MNTIILLVLLTTNGNVGKVLEVSKSKEHCVQSLIALNVHENSFPEVEGVVEVKPVYMCYEATLGTVEYSINVK